MFNTTVVQSWDPVPYHNAIFHHKTLDWGDFQKEATRKMDPHASLSRRSVSVGLGMNNKDVKLSFASVEHFHNSTKAKMQEDPEDFVYLFQTIKTDGGSDEDSDDEDPDDDSVLLEEF